jgi:hypothetical protein
MTGASTWVTTRWREILGAHDKKNCSVVGKKQKRKPSEKRKKTSVADVVARTAQSDAAIVLSHFFLSARIFLSMPAGGAPSECVFSSTTDMVTKKRNCLGDDSMEQMTIVRHFVRSLHYNFGVVAKKMEENAAKQKREAGVQARAAAQQGA